MNVNFLIIRSRKYTGVYQKIGSDNCAGSDSRRVMRNANLIVMPTGGIVSQNLNPIESTMLLFVFVKSYCGARIPA